MLAEVKRVKLGEGFVLFFAAQAALLVNAKIMRRQPFNLITGTTNCRAMEWTSSIAPYGMIENSIRRNTPSAIDALLSAAYGLPKRAAWRQSSCQPS
jgi:hypothetical protein